MPPRTSRRLVIRWLFAAALAAVAAVPPWGTAAHAAWNCADRARHTLDGTRALNLGQLKLQLRDYYYCGGYTRDFTRTIAVARADIHKRAPKVSKPALVLDVDETALSNWVEIEHNDFAYIPGGACTLRPGLACGVHAWELSARATALKPTLALFDAAKGWGVTVFFITGRRDRPDLRRATIENLREAGYHGWKKLVMRPVGSHGPVAAYKSAARAAIEAEGYHIVANVGDQRSDLAGGHAVKKYRVPNPFYYIP